MMQDDQDELNIPAPKLNKQVELAVRKAQTLPKIEYEMSPRGVQASAIKEDCDVIMNSLDDPTEL